MMVVMSTVIEIVHMMLMAMKVQVIMVMGVDMQMDMLVLIGSVGVTMGMEKFFNDGAMLVVHLPVAQLFMQQLMGHERQRQLEVVLLQEIAVIEDLAGRPVGDNPAVYQHQAPTADLQGDIQIMGA